MTIINPCHDCGKELDKDRTMLDVEPNGLIILLCYDCFWREP